MSAAESLPRLPFDRPGALHIAPAYRELQARGVTRVRTPAGDLAWLAARYDHVRVLFAHPALGRSHPDPANAARFLDAPMLGGPIGDSLTEQADHSRMRTALGKSFSPRRMEAMRPRVRLIVDDLLNKLAGRDTPVDLHEALSFPLPARVICELLGVPFDDQDDFRAWADGAMDIRDRAHAEQALDLLHSYMSRLIDEKRRQPGEDMISDMIEIQGGGRLLEQELTQLAVAMFLGGHETTVARMDFGVLLLLTHDAQREMLRHDPSLFPQAVEEILRLSVPGLGLIPRYASADIEIDGVTIAAGDLVLLGNGAANRDAREFDDPDAFDLTRELRPHVAFGYGPHFCLGASLARVELQTALSALFDRFPSLRLAVAMEELRLRDHVFTGGLVSLPVAW